MHKTLLLRAIALRPGLKFAGNTRSYSNAERYDPLRILFCGADDFSIRSLRAIRELQAEKPDRISSIEVVCRPDKRVGRGFKRVQEVPIKSVAKELQLPLHQIDTFTSWSPPSRVDLVIAVSFGLLVPSRILEAATFGGLNVHPSLLPDLRGPAPIQHALLKGRTHTGVSLQTMHPTRFDHGLILSQTPWPGVPILDDCTPLQLLYDLGKLGAEMLSKGIEDGLFISPKPVIDMDMFNEQPEHAPKITPEDRHIDWQTWTSDRIVRTHRVLGDLWDRTTYQSCYPGKEPKLVKFHGPWKISPPVTDFLGVNTLPRISLNEANANNQCLVIRTSDGREISPASVTVEGEQKGRGVPKLVAGLLQAGLKPDSP